MASTIAAAVTLLLVLSDAARAGESGSGEKIIIHVPYKIHNHVHTHTNYKVIKVPEKTVESHAMPVQQEEGKEHYSDEVYDIPTTTSHHLAEEDESQFKPSAIHNFDSGAYESVEETRNHVEQPITEHILGLPTRVPTFKLYTPQPDYQFGEDNSYVRGFSTKAPFASLYQSQTVHPTYEVEEENREKLFPQNHVSYGGQSMAWKPGFFHYAHRSPYVLRSGKFFSTPKTFTIPSTTKMFVKTTPKFVIPTTKTFTVSSPKPVKKIVAKNEEYEHIGYLVVGENTHKFVGVGNKN